MIFQFLEINNQASGVQPFPEIRGAVNANYGVKLIVSLRFELKFYPAA